MIVEDPEAAQQTLLSIEPSGRLPTRTPTRPSKGPLQEGANQQLDTVRSVLGRPFFDGYGALLYHGDCLEAMRQLPSDLVALTVTSPPYNIGKEYERLMSLDSYIAWCTEWMSQIYRLTDATGAFWLNLGYVSVVERGKAVPLPYLLWDRSQFFLMQEVVWNYGAGVAARQSFSPRNEKFLWYVKNSIDYTFNLDAIRDPDVKYPNQKKNGKLKCNPLGKNPSDVWQFPKVTSGTDRSSRERTPHPAQFPVAVIDRIVKACSMDGQLVMDPFIGSGTTADVSVRLGRRVIGFDTNEAYLQVAAKRIEQAALAAAQATLL